MADAGGQWYFGARYPGDDEALVAGDLAGARGLVWFNPGTEVALSICRGPWETFYGPEPECPELAR